MKLALNSLYSEPGYSFKISHLVLRYIREQLIAQVMEPYELSAKDESLFLALTISTNSKTVKVEVKGPHFDKLNGFINYGLWLPYKSIIESKNLLADFIKYLFDGLVILFSKYSVKENDIRKVQKLVEKEVLNNPNYRYQDENDILPPDLSHIDFDE